MPFRMLLVLAAAVVLMAQPAQAGFIYSFGGVTNNNATNVATGQSQLTVEVSDAGTVNGVNRVSFTFHNSGPKASSITDVYFDDGTLLGIASITGSGIGVKFSQGATPPNLPGGEAINFHTSKGFLADSDAPVQPNGVNPGEWLTVTFNLINNQTFQGTLDAMAYSLAHPGVDMEGGLRIGVHVQGFSNGGSESFVNGQSQDVKPTPAPQVIVLLASALPVFAFGRAIRRRNTPAAA